MASRCCASPVSPPTPRNSSGSASSWSAAHTRTATSPPTSARDRRTINEPANIRPHPLNTHIRKGEHMRAWLISLLLAVSASAFAASDYAREKKWDDEITPGLVVGDPVYLEQKNRHKFLGIYTEATNTRMGVVVVHGAGIY